MSRKRNENRSPENLIQTISLEKDPSQEIPNQTFLVPVPTSRVSLPVRGANPEDSSLNRELADISVDNLLIRESDLNSSTENLLVDVTKELTEIDKSLIRFTNQTKTIMSDAKENSDNEKQSNNPENSKSIETHKSIEWSGDDIQNYNFPGTQGMVKDNLNDRIYNDTPETPKGTTELNGNLQKHNIETFIEKKIQEILGHKASSSKLENVLPDRVDTDTLQTLINIKIQEALGKKLNTEIRPESSTVNSIGLKEALNLLPKSCDGRDIEQLDIFLEKCDFAMSCVAGTAKHHVLQSIMTRLTGKARQVSRNRTFYTWNALREFLKANLEPQRTTQHLYLELYNSKQRKDEDVLSYSMRVEELQTLIIEQETAELSAEAARAMEISIKRQTKQVFMEGLGYLKGFIKARNPPTLEVAIQAAREEEKIKTSSEESKRLYQGPKRGTETYNTVKRPSGPCHVCKKPGHWARDCRSTSTTGNQTLNKDTMSSRNNQRNIHAVSCQYCKKPGHTKDVCRKLKYVTGKRNEENISGNQQQSGPSGSRPAGNLKTAAISFAQPS